MSSSRVVACHRGRVGQKFSLVWTNLSNEKYLIPRFLKALKARVLLLDKSLVRDLRFGSVCWPLNDIREIINVVFMWGH